MIAGLLAGAMLSGGCSSAAVVRAPSEPQAQALADEAVSAVLADNPTKVYSLLTMAFRSSTPTDAALPMLERIINYGGKPLRATFKQVESGTQVSPAGTFESFTFWYLLDTSGGSKGPYYAKVDVVTDQSKPAVSQISVVNFPVNGPPDSLK